MENNIEKRGSLYKKAVESLIDVSEREFGKKPEVCSIEIGKKKITVSCEKNLSIIESCKPEETE